MKKRILGISGSLRSDSWNSKLLNHFLSTLSDTYESKAETISDLPFVNEDLEKNPLPESILRFRQSVSDAQVIAIASPEYNGSFSSALKNAIDWATRPPGNLWQGKVVVLLSASPGALGGARGLIQLKTVVSGIKAWVLPEQVQCSHAHEAFSSDGKVKNEAVLKQMEGLKLALKNFPLA
ncbi:MAG: NAD(P)H-dependent oxidoreductase [Oligoflexia bacterium]|nr:NAD(P)H-dependent oxidoreductase [Oligoflexia bacterium]